MALLTERLLPCWQGSVSGSMLAWRRVVVELGMFFWVTRVPGKSDPPSLAGRLFFKKAASASNNKALSEKATSLELSSAIAAPTLGSRPIPVDKSVIACSANLGAQRDTQANDFDSVALLLI